MDEVQKVKFQKADIGDADVFRLLDKLDNEFPKKFLLYDIERGLVTANKVFCNDELIGVLICRAFKSYKGELCIEIDHMIAADNISRSMGSVLRPTLWKWAATAGFDRIFQHTHTPALARCLRSTYGDAKEMIFSKDLHEFKQGVING